MIQSPKTQKQHDAIAQEICSVDGLIGEMVDNAAECEISWSVIVSRLLTHGIVGLHHLLLDEKPEITEREIKAELLQSTAMIYDLFVAQREMSSPRILH